MPAFKSLIIAFAHKTSLSESRYACLMSVIGWQAHALCCVYIVCCIKLYSFSENKTELAVISSFRPARFSPLISQKCFACAWQESGSRILVLHLRQSLNDSGQTKTHQHISINAKIHQEIFWESSCVTQWDQWRPLVTLQCVNRAWGGGSFV